MSLVAPAVDDVANRITTSCCALLYEKHIGLHLYTSLGQGHGRDRNLDIAFENPQPITENISFDSVSEAILYTKFDENPRPRSFRNWEKI